MNPGDVRFLGGRISLASSVSSKSILVEPRVAVERLQPGDLVRFGIAHAAEPTMMRMGWAAVQEVDKAIGRLTFDQSLNCYVPAVATGDTVWEYAAPCTRCECKRCRAERASLKESDER